LGGHLESGPPFFVHTLTTRQYFSHHQLLTRSDISAIPREKGI
jgi:hypothetical protein